MRWIVSSLFAMLAFAAAPAAAQADDAAARHAAAAALDGLTGGRAVVVRQPGILQHDITTVMTSPRASPEGGVCERDKLTIERAPGTPVVPDDLPGIRRVEAQREYAIVADARGRPQWELTGDALELRCADPEDQLDYFYADSAAAARGAVAGLVRLKTELRYPDSPVLEWRCRLAPCPDEAALGAGIDPIRPIAVGYDWQGCPRSLTCVRLSIPDPGCGGSWWTQLRMTSAPPYRFRSARIGDYWPGECSELMDYPTEPSAESRP